MQLNALIPAKAMIMVLLHVTGVIYIYSYIFICIEDLHVKLSIHYKTMVYITVWYVSHKFYTFLIIGIVGIKLISLLLKQYYLSLLP